MKNIIIDLDGIECEILLSAHSRDRINERFVDVNDIILMLKEAEEEILDLSNKTTFAITDHRTNKAIVCSLNVVKSGDIYIDVITVLAKDREDKSYYSQDRKWHLDRKGQTVVIDLFKKTA